MPETKKTETAAPVEPQQVSKQRQITATGASLVVTVVLSALASYGINKVAAQVHNSINPPPAETNTSN